MRCHNSKVTSEKTSLEYFQKATVEKLIDANRDRGAILVSEIVSQPYSYKTAASVRPEITGPSQVKQTCRQGCS